MMVNAKAVHLTEHLVRELNDIADGPIPNEVNEAAKLCIVDWLAVTLAGAQSPAVDVLIEACDADCGSSACTLIGRALRTTANSAALVNGFSADVHDFSDHNLAMHGHPSACVMPVALALGEMLNVSGAAVIRAYIVGVEAACRVGNIVDIAIQSTAFHPTAMFGSFGAAAAAAQMLGLDTAAWLRAFGILGTQAAGLKASAGTQCKPFHAGKAAGNGLLAARLAKRGFTAELGIMEHRVGFLAGHVGNIDALPLSDALNEAHGRFLILNNTVKEYAACRLTHGTINIMRQLRDQYHLVGDEVIGVALQVPPSYLNICNIPAPITSLEAKFSLRAMAALALLGYDMGRPESYDELAFKAPHVTTLRDRVSVVPRPESDFEVTIATITLNDGRILTTTSDDRDSTGDLVMHGDVVRRKFMTLAEPIIGADNAAQLLCRLMALEEESSLGIVLGLATSRRIHAGAPAFESLEGR